MLQGIENIFDNKDNMLKHLKKKNFEENTENFKATFGYLFDEMFEYVGGAEDKEAAAEETKTAEAAVKAEEVKAEEAKPLSKPAVKPAKSNKKKKNGKKKKK